MKYWILLLFSMPVGAAEWGRYAGAEIPTFPIITPSLYQMEMSRRPDVWALEMKARQKVALPPAQKSDFVTPPNVGQNRLKR